jgi:hypothetical protein
VVVAVVVELDVGDVAAVVAAVDDDGGGGGSLVEVGADVDVGAAASDVQAPTTTVAPSARKVRRDSRVTGRS